MSRPEAATTPQVFHDFSIVLSPSVAVVRSVSSRQNADGLTA